MTFRDWINENEYPLHDSNGILAFFLLISTTIVPLLKFSSLTWFFTNLLIVLPSFGKSHAIQADYLSECENMET